MPRKGRDPSKPLKTKLLQARTCAHIRIALIKGLSPKQIVARRKFRDLGVTLQHVALEQNVLDANGIKVKQPQYILTKASIICNLSVRRFRHLVDQYGLGTRVSPRVTLLSLEELTKQWNVDRDFGSPSHRVSESQA